MEHVPAAVAASAVAARRVVARRVRVAANVFWVMNTPPRGMTIDAPVSVFEAPATAFGARDAVDRARSVTIRVGNGAFGVRDVMGGRRPYAVTLSECGG